VGLTSPGNLSFVHSLQCCDQLIAYGHEAEISANTKTAYVDMSGNRQLTETLHHLIGDNMVESCMVGATHWEKRGRTKDLPGAQPTFFFAPGHIAKRDKDWGPGVLFEKANVAGAEIARKVSSEMSVETIIGAEAAADIWKAMLENQVSPKRGIIISIAKV
jgi:hypothetical protein